MARKVRGKIGLAQVGRRLVQISFLALFLFPLGFVVYKKISFNLAPDFTSWLLPWDPQLLITMGIHGNFPYLVIGAPLMLLALSWVFGRFFCGWVCPLGTVLDLIRPVAFWQRRKPRRKDSNSGAEIRNSPVRYFLLLAVLAGSLVSLKLLGLFDPLVIFNRGSVTLAINYFSSQQNGMRSTLAIGSLILLGILILELWQPRFWCRNLCPLGALISLASRFSLLKREISQDCTHCSLCQRSCPMSAISNQGEGTDYSQCTFCLECTPACPWDGIKFGFSGTATAQREEDSSDFSHSHTGWIDRRKFLVGAAYAIGGAAILPLTELAPHKPVLRPPGALPETDFLRTCILCQECIRICPTGALRPSFLESGLAGIGTPVLVPRQGGCALNPSCPDLCASVCPVGALRPITPDQLKIGLARVHRECCLAWDQGAKCLVCVEACLNSAAVAYQGRVTVDPNRCTGCGRCESGCPVPGSAIRVEPRSLA